MTIQIIRDTIYEVRVRRTKQKAAVAQSVERRIGSAEVTGPIPVSSSPKRTEIIDFSVISGFFVFIRL